MIRVECAELSGDEELALANHLSDSLGAGVIVLAKDPEIVFDVLPGGRITVEDVVQLVREFVARRKEAQFYSIEVDGDKVTVHSADPTAANSRRTRPGLPPNVYQCPFCPFVTIYPELYIVHTRSHGFT